MATQQWISLKTPPEDDNLLCVFGEWYPSWAKFVNSEVFTWKEIKAYREWELKNSYTHWFPLPALPPSPELLES